MTKSSLAIIGKNRLADELLALAQAKGLEATYLSDATTVASTANFVIDSETGAEDKKRAVLQRLDASLPAASVIVSSCLRFSTTQMASWLNKPERLVGFATFYPVKDRRLIELTAGLRTGEPALVQAEQLLTTLGKESVRVKDSPGLTFPRILSLIINEAARSLEEGVASAEEIDVAMRLGVNYPHGPLKWADQIGLDEVVAVLEGLQRETGDDRYRPTPLLKKLVTAGFLGEISGRGFYPYEEGQVKP
ncbi:MAG TPA: 3-hydroxyacyl-CoA dehydrogenase family protein [Candidatus Binatia bacterium]|jgi:3-hydroxybutyryl-CoA dehydrogenase